MTEQHINTDTQLLAAIADAVRWIAWARTQDGAKNRHRPESILDRLLHPEKGNDVTAFRTPDDFERARSCIMERLKDVD